MLSENSFAIVAMGVSAGLFLAAFVAGLREMRASSHGGAPQAGGGAAMESSMGVPARVLTLLGISVAVSLGVWRAVHTGRLTLPLTNHIDAFNLLAVVLAALLVYCRATRNLRGLAFFLLPVVAAVLVLGGGLALMKTDDYSYHSVWSFVHIASLLVGTACAAGAFAGAVVFLIASRQLKRKGGVGGDGSRRWIGLPSLATIERFNRALIFVSFPMLTLGIVTGILRMAQHPDTVSSTWSLAPKIVLGFAAWMIYGLLVQLPLAPSFRGQRAAWLSIAGFMLFLSAYVAVNWMK